MNKKDIESFVQNSKSLRISYNLSQKDIEELLKEKKLKYINLESGTRKLTDKLADAIAALFNLTSSDFTKSNLEPPAENKLPVNTLEKVISKKGARKVNSSNTQNYNSHAMVILYGKEVGYEFTDSSITKDFPKDHNIHKTKRSLEWNKGTITEFVTDTKRTQKSTEKLEVRADKIYSLIKKITPEALKEAEAIIAEAKEKSEKDAAENEEDAGKE